MRNICKIVLYLILGLLLISLVACSKTPVASDTIADSASSAVAVIGQTLPKECQTAVVQTQLLGVQTQIKAITSACATEKEAITQEKVRWQWAFWGLLAVIGIYVAKRVLK